MNSKNIEAKKTTVKLVYTSMLIAISLVGSLIKIQGSIALDSMAGFFSALFLGPVYGLLTASIGHILTAVTSGFPLTLPIHIIVTVQMGLFAYIFGVAYRKSNGIIASIIAIILNGVVSVLMLVPVTIWLKLPLNGWPFFYTMVGPLSLSSGVNVILAYAVYKIIGNKF
ncbi:alpha-ribazole transporter [Gottschalkia purinilytica]|uniref:Alpha-ribazole transporter n=1 Tax=Gottschalkia purinilytica TaxID=1503 RepID=A0A0L0W8K9_GOTPU|nr:ECF transporter S component [Gottschalkia purinilytica]KNF07903.1 alpha-ribazole transporter [Gottschalkia purinilytica]